MTNMSIREFLERFETGKYEYGNRSDQVEAGWYDWFCADEALARKTQHLGKKVKQLAKSPKINIDTMYVFFKNNCPVYGNNYDSFSICSLRDQKVLYWITPKYGHDGPYHNKPRVSNFLEDETEMNFNNWIEVRRYFGV